VIEINNGVLLSVQQREDKSSQIEELISLCSNIDINVEKVFQQKRNKYDLKYYCGKGKLLEIKEYMKALKDTNIKYLIVNDRITNIQRKNIQKIITNNFEIIDRTQVILEIFRKNAKTKISKIQVELASLKFEYSSLKGQGNEMSRTGGGIGTIGPGETQLEYDRRTINKRINQLKEKLKEATQKRDLTSKNRDKLPYPKFSLVGYTSAGKSTLLKTLTEDKNLIVSEKYFSTLSPTNRKIQFPCGLNSFFSDTVGFIENLPIELVESFKSTLEEINNSDIILHLIDSTDKNLSKKISVVNSMIEQIEFKRKLIIKVFTKIDLLNDEKYEDLKILYPESYFINCLDINSINNFLNKLILELKLLNEYEFKKIQINYNEYWKIEKMNGIIGILSKSENEKGYEMEIIKNQSIKEF
jgi:GTP-binding protein HflX